MVDQNFHGKIVCLTDYEHVRVNVLHNRCSQRCNLQQRRLPKLVHSVLWTSGHRQMKSFPVLPHNVNCIQSISFNLSLIALWHSISVGSKDLYRQVRTCYRRSTGSCCWYSNPCIVERTLRSSMQWSLWNMLTIFASSETFCVFVCNA